MCCMYIQRRISTSQLLINKAVKVISRPSPTWREALSTLSTCDTSTESKLDQSRSRECMFTIHNHKTRENQHTKQPKSYPSTRNRRLGVMRVLIGGGSGFVGRELTRLLRDKGHEVTVISRQAGPGKITWGELESGGLPPCDGAVNLAGENLMNPLRWWNESYKKDLFSSRIDTTRTLAQAIAASPSPPQAWVLVTGVACYKPSVTAQYTEDSEWVPFDLLSRLVKEWEGAGRLPENIAQTTKQVVIRPGVVLGRDGGAIKQMMTPFWLGLGGTLGSGRQPFPWIHVSDLAGIIAHALEPSPDTPSPAPQVLNGVAPAENTNYDFTKELGRVLRRPTIFPVPGFVINALLGSERAVVLTQGQKVAPKRTLETGFQYQYPDLSSALREIVDS